MLSLPGEGARDPRTVVRRGRGSDPVCLSGETTKSALPVNSSVQGHGSAGSRGKTLNQRGATQVKTMSGRGYSLRVATHKSAPFAVLSESSVVAVQGVPLKQKGDAVERKPHNLSDLKSGKRTR